MKRLSIVFAIVMAWQVGVARAEKPEADAAKYAKSRTADHVVGRPETDDRDVVLRAGDAAVRRPEGRRPPQRGGASRAASASPGGDAVVWPVQRASAVQFRSDPQRIFAWLVLGQRLLSISLVRQQRASDHRPPRVGPVPAVTAAGVIRPTVSPAHSENHRVPLLFASGGTCHFWTAERWDVDAASLAVLTCQLLAAFHFRILGSCAGPKSAKEMVFMQEICLHELPAQNARKASPG